MSSEGLQRIDEDECYLLVRGRSLGRVGVKLAEELVILPVYYGVLDRDIVFRTDPGTKLAAAVLGDRVAFEVDNAVPAWSVLFSGHAREIRESGEQVSARDRGWATIGPPASATRSSASPSIGSPGAGSPRPAE